jgi:hypothetical protein
MRSLRVCEMNTKFATSYKNGLSTEVQNSAIQDLLGLEIESLSAHRRYLAERLLKIAW